MRSGLGKSSVEVQGCPLRSGGPWLRSSGARWAREVPVEVPRCPLDLRGRWLQSSSATDIGRWLLRSSGAHWDRALAVEVQQCPLRSGAGEEARRRRGEEEERCVKN